MQAPTTEKPRTGCVTWMAALALLIAVVNLFWNTIQELAWNRRVEAAFAPVTAAAPAVLAPVEAPAELPVAVAVEAPTVAPARQGTGPAYVDICQVDTSDMTELQLIGYVQGFVGQSFTGWTGYVYDVYQNPVNDQYILLLADEPQDDLWSRDIEVQGIPADLAAQLRVNQVVTLDGRIAAVEAGFGIACNPITVDQATVTLR